MSEVVYKLSDIAVLIMVPVYIYLLVKTRRLMQVTRTRLQELLKASEEQFRQGQVMNAGLEFVRHVVGCKTCKASPLRLCPIGKLMQDDYLEREEQARLASEVKT